jgi:hypothetical protein
VDVGFETGAEEVFFSDTEDFVGSTAGSCSGAALTFSFFSSIFSTGLGDGARPPILSNLAGPVDPEAALPVTEEGVPVMGARGGGSVGRPLDFVDPSVAGLVTNLE